MDFAIIEDNDRVFRVRQGIVTVHTGKKSSYEVIKEVHIE